MDTSKQTEKKSSFENLKELNNIITGKGINEVFSKIKNSKSTLDSFCKTVKTKKEQCEKANAIKQVQVKAEPALKPAETSVVAKNTVTQSATVANTQSNTQVHQPATSAYNRQGATQGRAHSNDRPQSANTQNRTAGYQGGQDRRPYGDRPQGGNYQNRSGQPGSYQPRQNTNQQGRPYGDRPQGGNYQNRTGQQSMGTGYQNRTGQQGTGTGYQNRTGQYGANTGYQNRTGQQGTGAGYQNRTGQYAGGQNRPQGAFNKDKDYDPKKQTGFNKPKTVSFTPETNAPKATTFGANKAKSKSTTDDRRTLNIREKMRMGHLGFDKTRFDSDNAVVKIKSKKNRDNKKQERIEITNAVITEEVLTIKILSEKIGKPATEIIKKFLLLGLMYNINSVIDFETAELVCSEFGIALEHNVEKSYEEKLEEIFKQKDVTAPEFVKRPPVITVMGHVDHGKTSLLDYIKKSHVSLGEAGGITQHIGAYSINVNNNDITFIDTPGHEAFSEMRARGATVADIAILIVAADDGIMPQTREAAKQIKEAGIPMIVAVNKIDKPAANIERIKQQLTEIDVLVEEWGGDTIYVPISAKTGEGIDKLLEMILLVADMNELKADPNDVALGTCIESKVEIGRGVVASIVIKNGTLNVGDYLVCGLAGGRIKAMTDYKGESVKSAGPSMAVSVVGLNTVPYSGEMAYVVNDEKLAKNIIDERSKKIQIEKTQTTSGSTLEAFLSQNAENEIKTYKVIVKADVQGTSEAVKQKLESIKNEEVNVSVISSGVGVINESDVLLSKASNAQIIGFNTKLDAKARQVADKNDVDIKLFKIIYEAADFVEEKITKMKSPKYKESATGKAEVRQLFKISSLGVIAGSYVLEGFVSRNSLIRVLRNNEVISETTIETLQQHKDEAKQVRAGFECGIKLKGFNDLKVGDIIAAFENVRIS